MSLLHKIPRMVFRSVNFMMNIWPGAMKMILNETMGKHGQSDCENLQPS